MEIFKIENLTFAYPLSEKNAIDDISFSVNKGDFVLICGKSGCGKSTLLRQLKPVIAPHGERKGNVLFCDKDVTKLDLRTQTENIGFVLQNADNGIVTDKVWHELAFGLESLGMSTDEIRIRVAEMASFFGIADWFYKDTAKLSGGQKQLLNLASVMVMQPQVLILDEPTSQLDPIAATEFLETVYKINRDLGITVILSEHRLEEALPMSDKVVVMEDGKIIADCIPQEVGKVIKNNDMFLALPTPVKVCASLSDDICPVTVKEGRIWLNEFAKGKEIKSVNAEENIKNDVVIEAKNAWFRYEKNTDDVLKDISITIHKNEIYAIVGANGVGKSTTLGVINGGLKVYRGKVKTYGKVAMLPQNPQNLFVKNTVLSDLLDVSTDGVEEVVKICKLETLIERHPFDLSGGEQQRLALAKVLLTRPDIILLDEPTKALDAHFKDALGNLLKSLNKTVVIVSHDIEFCAKFADRCGMLFDGNIVSQGAPCKFFSGKNFYTTAANKMARDIMPDAIMAEDIINGLGGKK